MWACEYGCADRASSEPHLSPFADEEKLRPLVRSWRNAGPDERSYDEEMTNHAIADEPESRDSVLGFNFDRQHVGHEPR